VVEKVISSDGSIRVLSTMSGGQGIIDLSTSSSSGGLDMRGAFDEVMLLNAKQDVLGLFPYIRLLPRATASTGFIGKFRVPYELPGSFTLYLYLTMFTAVDAAASSVINLTASISKITSTGITDIVSDYATAISLPEASNKETFAATSDQTAIAPYRTFVLPAITGLAAGEVVAIKLVRATDTSYTDSIGVLDFVWSLRSTV
jgi:hypothetical protein